MKILACLLICFLCGCEGKKSSQTPKKRLDAKKTEPCIVEKMPIDTIWLAKALAYEGDTLPKELASYLKPLVVERLIGMPFILFEKKEANIDADTEKEMLVSFYHRYETSDGVTTLFLDKAGKDWIVQKIAKHHTRYPKNVKMDVDTLQKIVFLKSGIWGSGSGGYSCHLYKKLSGQYQEVSNFPLLIYYSMTNLAGLATKDSASYSVIDGKRIELTHYFNIMAGEQYLIKNKPRKEILVWRDEKRVFESTETPAEGVKFDTECVDILKQMYQNGSKEFKENMWQFAMQQGLIKQYKP